MQWKLNGAQINEVAMFEKFDVNVFDFDFLKNTYDGKRLIIKYPYSVMSRSCVFMTDHSTDILSLYRTLKTRLEAYKKRGFTIDISPGSLKLKDIKALSHEFYLEGHSIGVKDLKKIFTKFGILIS